MLKTPRAFVDMARAYTPMEWEDPNNDEMRNRTKKGDFHLTCEIGCKVVFRKGGDKRRSHFVHLHDRQCDFINKYSSSPGGVESEKHFRAKHTVGELKSFSLRCCNGEANCSTIIMTMDIDPSWSYKTEFRIGKYLMDGVFLDTNNMPVLIVEVVETHSTQGEKRKWLMESGYKFIEVPASNPSRVIDHWERALICDVCAGSTWEALTSFGARKDKFLSILDRFQKGEKFFDDNVMWILKQHPPTASKLKPGTTFMKPFANNTLALVDENGNSYAYAAWLKALKHYQTDVSGNEMQVDIQRYIEFETSNSENHKKRQREEDSDWPKVDTAQQRLWGLEMLKRRGVKKIKTTKTQGVVEFDNDGRVCRFALRTGKIFKDGKWIPY